MAAIALLLGKKQDRTSFGGNGTEGALILDAAMSIDHNYSAIPTKNPIERGSDITDHIRLENPSVQIEGIVSEAPLTLLGSALNVATGAVSTALSNSLGGYSAFAATAGFGALTGMIANRNADDRTFRVKAFEALIALRDKRTPFTVVTSLKTYSNMVVTKLTVPQKAEYGQSLVFNATFEQIQIVDTKVVILPERQTATGNVSKKDLGNQPPKSPSNENATILKSGVNKVVRAFTG